MPSPWVAETASGSPRPRPWNSAVIAKSLGRSALLTATRTGTSPPRSVFASSASPARSPARPSTTISTASASAIASRAWLCTSRASSASSSRSMPPVSISSKATPFHSQREPLAVAGDPGLGRGHGLAAADQAVDQGALADVGEADDGDGRQAAHRAGPCSAGEARRPSADDLFQARAPVVSSSTASVGGAQGAVLALGVAGVAAALGVEDGLEVLAGLGGAAAGALLVGGGEEDLQRRVGADHGADVAALGDVVGRRRSAGAGGRPSPRAPAGGRRPGRRRR